MRRAIVWSLMVRVRRAGPVEREQVRWIMWAAAVLLGLYVLALLNVLGSEGDRIALGGFALFPLAVGVAVLVDATRASVQPARVHVWVSRGAP